MGGGGERGSQGRVMEEDEGGDGEEGKIRVQRFSSDSHKLNERFSPF